MVENMIHIDAERLNRQYFYRGIKRLFDVVASAIGVVVISPVLLIIAICIKVDDPHGLAAIKGLLDLQQQRNSLSDKHLRPLEDNPLRLNMDYATALDVMFAEGKSPVHLAAPAAVSESLRNVRHHEEANRAAIVESLRVLLDAFSPQNLLRRFVQYRRSHELRQPLDDAGAWQMYSHY